MKYQNSFFIALLTFVFTSHSYAQTTCADLEELIDSNTMKIALSEFEGQAFDESAAQQTARNLDINNQL